MPEILFTLALAAALQEPIRQSSPTASEPRSRPVVVRDSLHPGSAGELAPRRLPVTSEVLRTAFRDAASRDMLSRARVARLSMDSVLRSYESTVRERATVQLAVGEQGRDRIFMRQESVTRVTWHADAGVHIEVIGWRAGSPAMTEAREREHMRRSVTNNSMTTIPYFPGKEVLWIGGQPTVQQEVDDNEYVHPLADGAEAYYTYASGDSMSWKLPQGQVLVLREIRFRARSPRWNLAVGSIWFDAQSGQVVRAAYRLAAPRDIAMDFGADAKSIRQRVAAAAVKAVVSPVMVQIDAITVEYGLFDGRFWLPRSRSFEGTQRMSFLRAPVTLEQTFSYAAVNAVDRIPEVAVNAPEWIRLRAPDSLSRRDARKWLDSAYSARAKLRAAFRDSVLNAPCDSSGYRVLARTRYEIRLPVAVTYPCEIERLADSEAFEDTRLYGENDEVFGMEAREALVNNALSLGTQALGARLPRGRPQYGLHLTRYNRVEGLSTGLRLEQELGNGYRVSALARVGSADPEPQGELSIGRTDLSRTLALTGYSRLMASSDWGNPLGFGSSVSALLFGRDDAFYYRAAGGELAWRSARDARWEWRLFAEQHRPAVQRAFYSVTGEFVPNIAAEQGAYAGAGGRFRHTGGADPHGLRFSSDLRGEAAGGQSSYGRASVDLTVSGGLQWRFSGALTVAGGSSVGEVPPQRRWFLGGTHTIRGLDPDTARAGNAFWMSRAELGVDLRAIRPVVFGDLGWVGDRSAIGAGGRPMSGAGVGLSVLDGMLRLDFARGINPVAQTRMSAYVEGRF
jgi:hypothetical protein